MKFINIVIGSMICPNDETGVEERTHWVVGAFDEYSDAFIAVNNDRQRFTESPEMEAAMKHTPHYEIVRIEKNISLYWELD